MLIAVEGRWEYYSSMEQIKDIWSLVSHNPLITIREMATETGLKRTKVHRILEYLERAGYIQHEPRRIGRRVIVPLVTQ